MDDIFDAAEEIGSQADKVMTSFEAGIQEILYAQGWVKDDVDLYVASGLLPRITQRLLSLYYELYLHFQKLIAHNPEPEHFKEFTMLHVEYHAKQLRHIRLYAVRRSQMLLRSYTYLRDAKAKGFTDIRLIGQVTQKLQDMTKHFTELQTVIERPTSKTPREWACAHCHSELHTGGMAACPLSDFKAKVARRVAKEAAKTIKEDPESLTRLITEEKKKNKE
jgi:beta-glucosidase-like glycosyl hydrolase